VLDVEICLEAIEKKGIPRWKVEVRSLEPLARTLVEPIRDDDLAAIADLPPEARTWQGLLRSLSPNDAYRPPSITLRAVGGLIMQRILGDRAVAQHLDRIEARARERGERIRILLEVFEGEDPILTRLPIELAHDGDRFFFKRSGVPSIRCDLSTEAKNLDLRPGARVLIATAHADAEPQPDRASLLAHTAAIAAAVRGAGFLPEHLADATAGALREQLFTGHRVGILYLVCHGIEDPDQMGQLVLRDQSLSGEELGRWLEEATELGRRVQVVILCACSSAVPQIGEGTSGMAQWIIRPRRALAAIGFRGPVLVPWALQWSERLFQHLGKGMQLEHAFAAARNAEPDGEPQWVLPLCYGRRSEPEARVRDPELSLAAGDTRGAPSSAPDRHSDGPVAHDAEDEAGPARSSERVRRSPLIEPASVSRALPLSRLPRSPRSYFTGRRVELWELIDWARAPGAAQITGEGGIGKTELATKLAHEVRKTGRSVVWLERADQDLRGALATLIAIRRPDFQAPPNATDEDLTALMRSDLAVDRGLLVLDNIADRSVVDRLRPGGSWSILVTTRVRHLLPGVLEWALRPLEPLEALELLARVVWATNAVAPEERAAAERLVERVGRFPLGIELAGGALRAMVTAEEYLADLERDGEVAASQSERIHAMILRSVADLAPPDERAFLALGILPIVGATAAMVATTLGEPVPPVVRRLDRLVRQNLVTGSLETERYQLHPVLHDVARQRARAQAETWRALHRGAAKAYEALAQWVDGMTGRPGFKRGRWDGVCDIFHALDPEPWLEGAPGSEHVAKAICLVAAYRTDRSFDEQEALLTTAEILSRAGDSKTRAQVLQARGELRRSRHDLDGAVRDYGQALALVQGVKDRLEQAGVIRVSWAATLKARGDLHLERDDLDRAADDYDQALALYEAAAHLLGQAHTLGARSGLRLRRDDPVGAATDYYRFLRLREEAEERGVEDRLGQANVLTAHGDLCVEGDDLKGAATAYGHAIALYQAVEDRLGQASVLKARGALHLKRSHVAAAAQDYDRAIALYQAVEDRLSQANVLKARGELRRRRGDLDGAAQDYDQALALYQAVEDRLEQANILKARGELRQRQADPEGAARDYDQALALFHALEDRLEQANVLEARGELRQERTDLDGAAHDYDHALALYEAAEDRSGQAHTLQARSELRVKRRDLDGAAGDHDQALALFKALGDRFGQANILRARGNLRQGRGDLDGAAKDYHDALALHYDPHVVKARGDLRQKRGNLAGAASDYDEAFASFKVGKDRPGQVDVLKARGDLELRREKLLEARRCYEKAESICRELQDSPGLGDVLARLAGIYATAGDRAAAEQAATEALSLALSSENKWAATLARGVLELLREQVDKS
jgi:tetratricopeptide (TPR) repeat protein